VSSFLKDNLVGIGDSPYSDLFTSQLKWLTAADGVVISADGLQASKNTNCSYAIVAADKGWNYGTHVWFLKAKMVACYDTIGVVDETYFEQVKPLKIGLGTYPGSHRIDDGAGIKYCGHSIMRVDTIVKCKLDFSAYEFSTEVLGAEGQVDVFSLTDHYKKGTKLYPALTLCNNSSYRFVSLAEIDPDLRETISEENGKPKKKVKGKDLPVKKDDEKDENEIKEEKEEEEGRKKGKKEKKEKKHPDNEGSLSGSLDKI